MVSNFKSRIIRLENGGADWIPQFSGSGGSGYYIQGVFAEGVNFPNVAQIPGGFVSVSEYLRRHLDWGQFSGQNSESYFRAFAQILQSDLLLRGQDDKCDPAQMYKFDERPVILSQSAMLTNVYLWAMQVYII